VQLGGGHVHNQTAEGGKKKKARRRSRRVHARRTRQYRPSKAFRRVGSIKTGPGRQSQDISKGKEGRKPRIPGEKGTGKKTTLLKDQYSQEPVHRTKKKKKRKKSAGGEKICARVPSGGRTIRRLHETVWQGRGKCTSRTKREGKVRSKLGAGGIKKERHHVHNLGFGRAGRIKKRTMGGGGAGRRTKGGKAAVLRKARNQKGCQNRRHNGKGKKARKLALKREKRRPERDTLRERQKNKEKEKKRKKEASHQNRREEQRQS